MGKITRLGGVFIKATDPQALTTWRRQPLALILMGILYMLISFAGKVAL